MTGGDTIGGRPRRPVLVSKRWKEARPFSYFSAAKAEWGSSEYV